MTKKMGRERKELRRLFVWWRDAQGSTRAHKVHGWRTLCEGRSLVRTCTPLPANTVLGSTRALGKQAEHTKCRKKALCVGALGGFPWETAPETDLSAQSAQRIHFVRKHSLETTGKHTREALEHIICEGWRARTSASLHALAHPCVLLLLLPHVRFQDDGW